MSNAAVYLSECFVQDLVDNADFTANVKILPGDIVIIPQAFF